MNRNFDNDIKYAIEDIQPDIYMKTRLAAKINDCRKPKIADIWKKLGAAALAVAIVCASAGGFSAYQQNTDDPKYDITIIAYASDEDDNKIGTAELSDKAISLPQVKLSTNEKGVSGGSSESGFMIKADNIDSVKLETEYGSFVYWNTPLQDYDEQVRGRINFIEIPLTDEETKDYMDNYYSRVFYNRTREREFVKKLIESRDCSEYFGDNSMDVELYDVDFCSKDKDPSGKNIITLSNTDELYDRYFVFDTNKAEIKLYQKNDVVPDIGYSPNASGDYTKPSEVPRDTITITVKFKDGKKAVKQLSTYFNDEGIMQIEFVK